MPAFTPVNAQAVQQQTVTGNTAVLPETIKQTQALNAANYDAITKMLDQASGGYYQKLQQKYLANIDRQLSGNVDLRENLAGTAASNLYRGVGGSQFGVLSGVKNAQSYIDSQKAAGASSLERWTNATAQIYQPVNAAGMFARNTLDVGTGLAHATEERNAAFQRDYVENAWDFYGSFGQQLVRFENTLVQLAGDIAGAAMA